MTRAALAAAGAFMSLGSLWLGATTAGAADRSAAPPGPPEPVTLTGTIVNATAGASVPGGLAVTATEVDTSARKVVATRRAPAGAGGAFRIEGLPGQPGDRYLVGTDYLGVTYSTEVQPPGAATLRVYETTTDDSVLSIPSETLTVLTGKQGTYVALQLLRVRNGSDRSYVGPPSPAGGGSRPTLELPIPAGAFNVALQSGVSGPLVAAPDGLVASTDPVLPGDSDVSYVYEVKVARSGWPMSRPVVYPTSRVEILADPGLTLTGPGLSFRTMVPIGKRSYRRYEGGALAPGTTLNADIAPASTSSATLWLGLGAILAIVGVAAVGAPRLARRRRRRTAGSEPEGPARLPDRERLIEEIAALDEAHEADGMPEEEYASRRAMLKDRLVASQRGGEAGGEAGAREGPAPPANPR